MKPDPAFVLDHAAWPAFLVDDSGMIRKANNAAVQTLGTVMEGESALSASIWATNNQQTAEEFLARVDLSPTPAHLLHLRVKGGHISPFHALVCAVTRDNRKFHLFQLPPHGSLHSPDHAIPSPETASTPAGTLAAHLANKQKLDCAMQLIRTVSLDFNNALTSILGHSSFILTNLDPDHPWRHSLIEIEKSAERAAEISQDLANFSRQDQDARSQPPGNLNRVLRHATALFQKPEHLGLHWDFQLENRLFTVHFDEAKMQQAFTRILENAVEAMGPVGHVTIRSVNHAFTEPVVSHSLQLPAGFYVSVEISDSGHGIPPETLPRVFEPFFTTKGPPHRGLGLAWVYGIITNHRGIVAITSPQNQGATVRIFLPAEEQIVRDQPTQIELLRGQETILYVDDEPTLLTLGQTVLSTFGYRVVTAASGTDALDIFNQLSGQIDLVITDLVMPGMSGRELIDQLRRRAPGLRILCTSGYQRQTGDRNDQYYLQKPFTTQELLRKVRQILNPMDAS